MMIGKKQLTNLGKYILERGLHLANRKYNNRLSSIGLYGGRGKRRRARKIWLRECHMARVMAQGHTEVIW